MKRSKEKSFILIELLVVISIIGLLASIVFATVGSAKTKAKDVAALASGIQLAKAIQICDLDSGKVTVPNSTTNPTNDFCSLGSSYGKWPKAPQGWVWYQYVWVDGENNLIYLTSAYSGKLMHCGHYPSWTTYYCPPNGGAIHVGLCRLVGSFGCTVYNPSNGVWE